MNIENAKRIPLPHILLQLGHKPIRQSGHDAFYRSPLREERTASFHVDTGKNLWFDFGEGVGGDVVSFVCQYLKSTHEDCTVADALRWLSNMTVSPVRPVQVKRPKEPQSKLSILDVSPLQSRRLLAYLESRGIDAIRAGRYFQEVKVANANTAKRFSAIGLRNDRGGFELRNQFIKISAAPKYITFIRGEKSLPGEVHVFEGGIDFVSALISEGRMNFAGDTIILNSTACLPYALPYLKNYSYRVIHAWLDNNTTGQKATQTLRSFARGEGMRFIAMNDVYAPHEDVNAWHMHSRGLRF